MTEKTTKLHANIPNQSKADWFKIIVILWLLILSYYLFNIHSQFNDLVPKLDEKIQQIGVVLSSFNSNLQDTETDLQELCARINVCFYY